MEPFSFNIILLPDEKTRRKAVELGSILARNFENHYTLKNESFIPHITVYQGKCPAKNYEKIPLYLAELAKTYYPFKLRIAPYEIFVGAMVFWKILFNKQLQSLHYKVADIINPLREGLFPPDIKSDGSGYATGQQFTSDQHEIAQKYGYPIAGKLYNPHITLGKLKFSVNIESITKILPPAESKFEVSEICLGRAGDCATVVEIQERFAFKK